MILRALILATPLSLTVADQVPTIDVAPGCRAAAAASPGLNQDVGACLKSENNAREQLVQQWSKFPAADRTNCLMLTKIGSNGTYTDLLTCLQIQRDARSLPKEPGLPGTVGQGSR